MSETVNTVIEQLYATGLNVHQQSLVALLIFVTSRETTRKTVLPHSFSVVELTGFDEFWAKYPKRIGKGGARTAYQKALNKVDHATIMRSLGSTKWSADKQFIPLAQTWLNGERWSDDTGGNGVAGPRRTWAEIKAERIEHESHTNTR